ncbi:hypothetical protein L249_6472 [Ophiocordyceps polyrhachis-furcata BCC 54312]|uniref:Uncharacterized protein n=1 Tax=Ophiocordyceps polyrhachis-furcata BCC 54312 TaxID=1330021 RepID=A0A367LK71_9HYPO|nr:hypothetical protein L249_6472 [Ophiocordyceps polyrhachis-furcata BCC 54312]
MDDYMFRHYVGECRVVEEATSYLELLNYSDPSYNSSEEHVLTSDEFENFLRRRVCSFSFFLSFSLSLSLPLCPSPSVPLSLLIYIYIYIYVYTDIYLWLGDDGHAERKETKAEIQILSSTKKKKIE